LKNRTRTSSAVRVADAFKKKLGVKVVKPVESPAASPDDYEAKLTKLKNLFDKGFMPQ
jgi:hypothetical protein